MTVHLPFRRVQILFSSVLLLPAGGGEKDGLCMTFAGFGTRQEISVSFSLRIRRSAKPFVSREKAKVKSAE